MSSQKSENTQDDSHNNLVQNMQTFTDLVDAHVSAFSNLAKKALRGVVGGGLLYCVGVGGLMGGSYLNPNQDSAKVYIEAKEKLRNLNFYRNNHSLSFGPAQGEYRNDAVSNLERQILNADSQVVRDLDYAINLVQKDVDALAQLPQIKSYDKFNDWSVKFSVGAGCLGVIVVFGSAIFYSIKAEKLTRKHDLQMAGILDSLIGDSDKDL